MIRSERTYVRLSASFENLHSVLADYGRYREWMPGVTQSRVLVHEGDIAVVVLEAHRFAARPVTFEFVRTTPDRIVFNQVGQLRVRGLSGAFTLTTAKEDAGSVDLEIEAGLRLPAYRIGPRRQLRRMVAEYVQALETRLRALARPQILAEKRRMILEVRRRDGKLEVWHRGRVFSCPLDPGDTPS